MICHILMLVNATHDSVSPTKVWLSGLANCATTLPWFMLFTFVD